MNLKNVPDSVANDVVALVKQDGTRTENVKAVVQSNEIMIFDTSLNVEEGDRIERLLPSGRVESYLVLDTGFNAGHGSVPAFYHVKVRKESAITAARIMKIIYTLGFVWAGLAIASFLAWDFSSAVKKTILIAWLLVPPIYFFIELHWVRKHLRAELDNCKMSQEAAAKIWAGVSAALALIYFGCK